MCANPNQKRIRSEARICELTKLIYWVQKFLIFSRINTTITVSHPKGLTWHFIETKAIKHEVGGQAVLGRQVLTTTPWVTERHGYDPTYNTRLTKARGS